MALPVDKVAREVKIAEIKRQIAAGAYESPEKLEKAVDAFLRRAADETRPSQPR